MKNNTFLLWIILLLLAGQSALAAGVTYSYSATVYLETRPDSGNPGFDMGINNGDPSRLYADGTSVTGQFTYDPSSAGAPVELGTGATLFPLPNLNLSGTIGTDPFSDPTGGALLNNENFNGTDDLFMLLASAAVDGFSGFERANDTTTFELYRVRIFWIEGDEDFFPDQSAPPGSIPANPGQARIALDFRDITDEANTQIVFAEPLNLQVIPVPAAAWLLASALGLLSFVRARHQ